MRVSLVLSFGFHIAVFVFAIYGLPSSSKSIVIDHQVIDVELIAVTETPEPEPIPKPAPPPKKAKAPPPPPPKPPEPPEQVASLPPEPSPAPAPPPEPKPEPLPKPVDKKPEPPAEPKAQEKPKPPQKRVAPRPKPRPKPDFASMMLKTVQKLKETPPPKPEKPKEKKKSFDEKMAALMKRQSQSQPKRAQRAPLGEKLSISEIDAIRRQVERCWLVPAAIGAKNVEEMAVQIRMKLNPDGTLRESRIVDRFRMETNPTYKAVAESALRAVRNPRCNKFTLPLQKYDVWKDMVLRFNPSEMVGR